MNTLSARLHCTLAIARADLVIRLRSPRFWIVLGLLVLATRAGFPGPDGLFTTAEVNGHYRAWYSSAWVGMLIGLLDALLLSLAGFYVIRGTVVRDIDTRVWQLLVATTMTRRGYLFAKWCSHMAVLLLMALVSLAVGLAMQWLRAEDRQFDLVEALKPIVLLALPALALTAAAAIWFDLLPPLRRTAGSVLFFFAWVATLAIGTTDKAVWENPRGVRAFINDPAGMVVFLRGLTRDAAPQLAEKKIDSFCLGCGEKAGEDTDRFVWKRWDPRPQDVVGRAFWLAVALAAVAAASPVLDWAGARAGSPMEASGKKIPRNRPLRLLTRALEPLQASLLGRMVSAELLLILRQRRILWWLALIVLSVLQAAAPADVAAIAVCLAWTLSLDVLGHAALRDRENGTRELVFSAAGATWRIFSARVIVLFAMALSASLPALLRFAADMPAAALAILVVSASLTVWGIAFGALFGNARAFEIVFCVLLYHGLNQGATLNVIADPLGTSIWHAVLLAPAIALSLWRWPRIIRA
ncbi:MAG TPA: hypothetical protein VF472_17080 [Burkholderiaceae bacterium]